MILWRLSETVLIYHHRPFWAADAIFAKQIMYVPNIIDLRSTKKTSLVSKLCSRCKKKSWSVFIIFARGGLCFIHPNHRHVGAVTVFYVSVHLFLLWYILIPAYLFHVRGVRKGGLPSQLPNTKNKRFLQRNYQGLWNVFLAVSLDLRACLVSH